MPAPNTVEHFWSHIEIKSANECWDWTKSKSPKGYGITGMYGKVFQAHRLAYTLSVGPIPDGLLILHSCHNPSCCNPNHLRPGTANDNTQDMVQAGRAMDGEKSTAKLTNSQVLEMRALFETGNYSQEELAGRFGVGRQNVSCIVRYKTWKHI